MNESVEESQQPTAVAAVPPATPANTSKPKPRFSKRKLLANRSLFLNPSYRGFFADELVEVVGKIAECPRKVNQNRYRVDWRRNDGKPQERMLQILVSMTA